MLTSRTILYRCETFENLLQFSSSVQKPSIWKRYIDDIFSVWDISKADIEQFIEQANSYHPTIKFTAEISDTETTFLDTVVYRGERFKEQSIPLDVSISYILCHKR